MKYLACVILLISAAPVWAQDDTYENPPETSIYPWDDDSVEYETIGTPWLGTELEDKGTSLLDEGHYEAAIDTLRAALDLARDNYETIDMASIFDHLGQAYQARGQFDLALDAYDSALVCERGFFEDVFGLGRTFNNIGSTLVEIGQYDRARAYLDSALAISTELSDTAARGATLNNIGNAHYGLGNFAAAIAAYDSARISSRAVGNERLEGYILNNLGFACAALGHYERALVYYDSSRAVIDSAGDLYGSGVVLNNLGEAYAALGQFALASAAYDSALVRRRLVKNRYGEGITLMNIGRLRESEGDWEGALDLYRRSIDVKEEIRNEFHSAEAAAAYGESEKNAYRLIIDLLVQHGRDKEAFEYLARSQSEELREVFRGSGIETYDPSLKNKLDRINVLENRMAELQARLQSGAVGADEYDQELADLEGEYNQELVDLKTYHPQVYDLLEPGKHSSGEIQAGIPDRVLYVQFATAEDRYLAFLLTRQTFTTVLLSPRADIDTLVESFRFALASSDRKDVAGALAALYDRLIRPLEVALETAQDLVVVPCGPLHYLPFPALIRKDDGNRREYLIEYKRVRYLPSATFIAAPDKKPAIHKANLIAFANADQTLPGAEEETRFLTSLYPRSTIFLKDQATKEKFFTEAGKYGIVHLATHGLLDIDPRRSRIVLAPPGPGDLTCREIMGLCGLFQKRTTLVTLSACATAVERDPQKAGRELTTLADAFQRAGVPSLVASLWSVSDASTARLMKDFYQNLCGGKLDKLEALRQAQIAMLRSAEYSDPFYWAPFILFGNPE